MKRRSFFGVTASALGVARSGLSQAVNPAAALPAPGSGAMRELFPRCQNETFLNAAGGTPLSEFALAGLRKYEDFWRLGPGGGRAEYVQKVLAEIRGLFGDMIGAEAEEIALIHCTKAGEQIVLDGLPELRQGGNIVTNDLHFNGSLHNLVGLKKSGIDVRITRSRDWKTNIAEMEAAIDKHTSLVTVSLISNINGHVEPIRQLTRLAHAQGAYVFADIIQAAGIYPLDVRAMGIDFAACSGYKWLYGPHGVGFFYARRNLQGEVLKDRLFPGHMRHNYRPWVEEVNSDLPDFPYSPADAASRYQPGHISYLGYAALYESLRFLSAQGVAAARDHSVRLNQWLLSQIDSSRYHSISPEPAKSPILTLVTPDPDQLRSRLRDSNIAASLSGNRLRISPALYSNENDMARLASALR